MGDSTYAKKATKVPTDFWLFLSVVDRTYSSANMRQFPFDASAKGSSGVTTTDLLIRNYGKNMLSAGKFSVIAGEIGTFATDHSLKAPVAGDIKLVFALKSDDTTNKALTAKDGYVQMKFAKATWGG